MKKPAFWKYDIGSRHECKRIGETKDQDCIISKNLSQTKLSKSKNVIVIEQGTKTAGQWQILSTKQIQKELR